MRRAVRISLILCFLAPGRARADGVAEDLLTGPEAYDGQPSLSRAPDGSIWCAWFAWEETGGRIVVRRRAPDGAWGEAETAVRGVRSAIRPTIAAGGAAGGGVVHLFWTEAAGGSLARIRRCQRGDAGWSEPETFSDPGRASQNQELAVGADGRFHVVWQAWAGDPKTGPRYEVVTTVLGAERSWSVGSGDCWDPSIAASPDGRHVWLAWSSYVEDDYDVFLAPVGTDGQPGEPRRLGTRGVYDLHPAVAVDGSGAIWVAWDEVSIAGHGGSGRTTITGANLVAGGEDAHRGRPRSAMRVVRVAGDAVDWIDTTGLVPPAPYVLAHAGVPRIAVGAGGRPWVAYRALHSTARGRGKSRQPYWWDVVVQQVGSAWSEPTVLSRSDGTLEEPAIAAGAGGIVVAWSMEHRRGAELGGPREHDHGGDDDEEDHHGDYDGGLGRDGEVLASCFPEPATFDPGSVPRTERPAERPVPARIDRVQAAYEVPSGETTLRLVWGDFHKHSNVSRCSTGFEPGPDDHYRYATDVCRYDFMAMSDHSEHTSPYHWSRLETLADLYHVPGAFVPFYGYEWTARWPIGHHNVIFRGKPDPVLRSNVDGARTTTDLWRSLEGVAALTIPHTTADPGMGTDFARHDPRFVRVVEIFQAARGSYEHDGCPRQHARATARGGFYRDALARGLKVGAICSSDHGWGTSYVAAYAEETTRESIFDAIHARRCYGSTVYGMVVDFRADGRWMGEEYAAADRPAFEIYVRSPVAIRSIEIVGAGDVLYAEGSLEAPLGQEIRRTWREPDDRPGETWYYLRVIRQDDEMAWTSPVWVTRP